MQLLSRPWNRTPSFTLVFIFAALFYGCKPKAAQSPEISTNDITAAKAAVATMKANPEVDTIPIISKVKLKLTEQYCFENYGIKSFRLDSPKMIVIHYTVIPDLATTIALFKRDYISADRKFIKQFSQLNVGIHYVIDMDGKIYNLLPDSIVARHLIGFNHVALGIENIAGDSTDLTDLQLKSNITLIRFLVQRYPEIQYLIGHAEYNRKDLPHYSLFRSLNKAYAPYDKSDPGQQFMRRIRDSLSINYGLAYKK